MNDLVLFPENDPTLVQEFIASQNWESETPFVLKYEPDSKRKLPFPLPITIKDALTKFCNLTGLLSYSLFVI